MCIAIVCWPGCGRFSTWPKSQDKNINILRTIRAKHFSSFLKDFQLPKIVSDLRVGVGENGGEKVVRWNPAFSCCPRNCSCPCKKNHIKEKNLVSRYQEQLKQVRYFSYADDVIVTGPFKTKLPLDLKRLGSPNSINGYIIKN